MLVLSRHNGERICIGNGIVITLVAARQNKAKIGIEAPPEILVDRQEVRDRKDAEAKHGRSCRSELVASHPR